MGTRPNTICQIFSFQSSHTHSCILLLCTVLVIYKQTNSVVAESYVPNQRLPMRAAMTKEQWHHQLLWFLKLQNTEYLIHPSTGTYSVSLHIKAHISNNKWTVCVKLDTINPNIYLSQYCHNTFTLPCPHSHACACMHPLTLLSSSVYSKLLLNIEIAELHKWKFQPTSSCVRLQVDKKFNFT